MVDKAPAFLLPRSVTREAGRSGAGLLRFLRTYARSIPAAFSMAVIVGVLVVAVFAPAIAPHDPRATDIRNIMQPVAGMASGSWAHVLGTDNVGRDVLSRALYGARYSMLVAVPATAMSLVLGVWLGLVSGYAKGTVDTLIMRFVDMQRALPMLVVAIAVMAFVRGGVLAVTLLLGAWGLGFFARLVRGDTLAATAQEYVQSARAIGASPLRIMFQHVLPNVTTPVIVLATFMLPQFIIIEASLSFLGLGVPPPAPSWGNMLAEGRTFLQFAWWIVMAPGLLLSLTVLSFNLAGDRLRDVLDPFLRGRAGV